MIKQNYDKSSDQSDEKRKFNSGILNDQVLLDHIKKNIEETERVIREYDTAILKKIEKLRSVESDLRRGNDEFRRDRNGRLRRIYEIMNEL